MSKKQKSKKEYKISKNLMYEERKEYKEMGEPDLTQNHLELFSDDIISDLHTILRSCSDNQKKARYIQKELKDLGFIPLGLGTNILTMYNPIYPGVVYKFALDDYGIADNINDSWLSDVIPHYAKFIARDLTGVVSVQQRYVVVKNVERMNIIRGDVLKLLTRLSKQFLIVDLGIDNFLNYGIDRNGDFVIVDGSDLYPLPNAKNVLRCKNPVGMKKHSHELKRCGGKLEYDKTFGKLICKECHNEYIPSELRPKKEDKDMLVFINDGLSDKERRQLEIEAIRDITRRNKQTARSVLEAKLSSEKIIDTDDDVRQMYYSAKHALLVDDHTDDLEEDYGEIEYQNRIDESIETDEDDSDSDDEDDDTDFIQLKPISAPASVPERVTVEPSVKYQIKEDSGIYISVSGDFDTAYNEYGLPVYLSLDNGQEYTKIIDSAMLKVLIDSRIKELKEDGIM